MLDNIKIKTLITAALGILIAMLLVVGAAGIYSTKHTSTLLQDTSLRNVKVVAMIEKIRFKMEINRSQILQALQHNPATEWAKLHDHPLTVHYKIIDDTTAEINALWSSYLHDITDLNEKALADTWFEKSGKLGTVNIAAANAAMQQEKWDEAELILIKSINPVLRTSDVDLRTLTDLLAKRVASDRVTVAADISSTSYLMFGVLIVSVLIGAATIFLLIRGITSPLRQAIGIAERVAQGDLTAQISSRSRNEFGLLINALGSMNTNLLGIVTDVRAATFTIDQAADRIATGNADLSLRTAQQASSLEKTASSMEELTATVKQNSDNAMQADQLALSA
ncbi:Tar ligand binding domain-containing protein, partial [Undibacterium sp. 5I1]